MSEVCWVASERESENESEMKRRRRGEEKILRSGGIKIPFLSKRFLGVVEPSSKGRQSSMRV